MDIGFDSCIINIGHNRNILMYMLYSVFLLNDYPAYL